MVTDSDLDLLEAWRSGDEKAGNLLVRRYFARVYHFFASKVAEGIEDLTQQTFEACVHARDRIDDRGTFAAYLFGIARGKLLHHFRRLRRHDDRLDPLACSVEDLGGSIDRAVAMREEQRVLMLALRRLPLDHQIALEMHYWEDMTVAEIGAVLDAPDGTVKSRLHRARERLREHIAELAGSPDVRDTTLQNLDRWARTLRVQVSDEPPDEPA
jgi:RNA polymerase sigma-70 factor (ECF subfamily)